MTSPIPVPGGGHARESRRAPLGGMPAAKCACSAGTITSPETAWTPVISQGRGNRSRLGRDRDDLAPRGAATTAMARRSGTWCRIRDYLRARGQTPADCPVRMPGKVGRAHRTGENLSLDGAAVGMLTWEDFLAERVATWRRLGPMLVAGREYHERGGWPRCLAPRCPISGSLTDSEPTPSRRERTQVQLSSRYVCAAP